MLLLEHPKYLYLLALLPVLWLVFLAYRWWQQRMQKRFASPEMLQRLAPDRSNWKPLLKLILWSLAFASAVVALANPKMGSRMEKVKREGIDIVFAVDVSRSMLAEDVAPSRLERSKQLVSQIINNLGNDRVALVAYAGGAYPVLPLTNDYAVARMMLQQMDPDMVSTQGTNLSEALQVSADFFDKGNATNKLIIMLSDGEDHEGDVAEAIALAKQGNIRVLTLGVGTPNGGPIPIRVNGVVQRYLRDRNDEVVTTRLDESVLRQMADETKGAYRYADKTKTVTDFVEKELEKIEKSEFESLELAAYESQFQWFLALAFALWLLDVFLHERKTAWIRKWNLFNEKKA